ncbi:hypothetical protein [Brevundimonas sp.]|uniref:hypothetical protein n=1 Tax=Brevundimonas sp. TaxID=1871086 RepID=UPI0025BD21C8|nr:hypothetical protein [Brevundimonas sp.]
MIKRFLTPARLGVLFFLLFGLLAGGAGLYQVFWGNPADRCETSGRWWWAEQRRCVTPVAVADITGRKAGQSRAEASADNNRELVAVEHRLAAERRARDEATRAERARVAAETGN